MGATVNEKEIKAAIMKVFSRGQFDTSNLSHGVSRDGGMCDVVFKGKITRGRAVMELSYHFDTPSLVSAQDLGVLEDTLQLNLQKMMNLTSEA